MKVFEARTFSENSMRKYLTSQVRREGILRQKDREVLGQVKILYRPFRRVSWKLESISGSEERTSSSFIDEQLSPVIVSSEHRFLLWRPRYADTGILEQEMKDEVYIQSENNEAVKHIVDDLMLHRWKGQELDDELQPKLRKLQSNPLSVLALIVPRTPYSLKRENQVIKERKEIQSFVLASSLIANCSPKDIMISSEIGERVFVQTIVAEYKDALNGSIRLLLLETPGAESLHDAQKSGAALDRICSLYPKCIGDSV